MSDLILPAPLPKPWIITNEEFLSQASSFTLIANDVYLYLIECFAPNVVIPTMRYRMAATIGGTVDLGIYDGNGNLMGHTGAVATQASGLFSVNLLASVILNIGRYALALCPSNATDTYAGASSLKAGGGRYALATNVGTAGVLPATTGTVLTATVSPIVAAVVSGGAP